MDGNILLTRTSVAAPGSADAGPGQSCTGHRGNAVGPDLFHLRIIVHQEICESSEIGPFHSFTFNSVGVSSPTSVRSVRFLAPSCAH